MSTITKPIIQKGQANVLTLSKSELATQSKIVSDSDFNDQSNWKQVVLTYESTAGKQMKRVVFDASEATPEGVLELSDKAKNEFKVKSLTIFDFDGGYLKLERDELTVLEFDIDFISPIFDLVTVSSNNINNQIAYIGDEITLTFTVNEPIKSFTVVILGNVVSATLVSGNTYEAKYIVQYSDVQFIQNALSFNIIIDDFSNNTSEISSTIDSSDVAILYELDESFSISAGTNHSLALKADGRVYAWGSGASGRLGDNTVTSKSSPVLVVGQSDFVAISAGSTHSLALKADGRVYAWGFNGDGRLGDGTTDVKISPVLVVGESDFVAVAAGLNHSLALKADGRVYAWGFNGFGELGDDTTDPKSSPVLVVGESDFVAIAAGYNHSLALKADGRVYAWGNNSFGELGRSDFDDDITVDKSSPALVVGQSDFVAIDAGLNYSLALKADGRVYAWGRNNFGQLGDNTVVSKSSATLVVGQSGFVAIAAGDAYSIALKADGRVFAWGNNNNRLGDGTTANKSSPVSLVHFDGQLIPNGDFASGNFTGFGVANGTARSRWVVSTAVAATGTYSAYITSNTGANPPPWTYDGEGSNRSHFWFDLNVTSDAYIVNFVARVQGELYNNNIVDFLRVRASDNITTNPVGNSLYTAGTTIAIRDAGLTNIFNEYTLDLSSAIGQTVRVCFSWIQDTSVSVNPPAMVDNIRVGKLVSIGDFVAIDAAKFLNSTQLPHSLALKADGRVFAWGNNANGELGDNTVISRLTPVQVVSFNRN
jgi:alpha-tubulin suppressor-like RCC1 family protein